MRLSWGGIDNTQTVNQEGQYSLDACQNNPDFDGSLRQGLNAANDKLTDMAVIADFYKIRKFLAGSGTNGYIKCAAIKILEKYANVPIMFEISGREWTIPAQLYIRFANNGTLDPAIKSFVYTGNLFRNVALCKLSESNWGLYVNKSEAYDCICIHRYSYSPYTRFDISFPNLFTTELPTNALQTIHPTKYTD